MTDETDTWNDIHNMVTDIAAKNMIDVEAQFKRIMDTKVTDSLDLRRHNVAASIYGTAQQSVATDERPDEGGSDSAEQ